MLAHRVMGGYRGAGSFQKPPTPRTRSRYGPAGPTTTRLLSTDPRMGTQGTRSWLPLLRLPESEKGRGDPRAGSWGCTFLNLCELIRICRLPFTEPQPRHGVTNSAYLLCPHNSPGAGAQCRCSGYAIPRWGEIQEVTVCSGAQPPRTPGLDAPRTLAPSHLRLQGAAAKKAEECLADGRRRA